VVRLLGIEGYGLLAGTVFVFATNVNRLLSFRMSEVTIKYVGEALAQNNKDRAAALVKGLGLAEAVTSIAAYLVLFVLTPWAAQTFAKEPSTAILFQVYGLYLLGNLIYETSTGVLPSNASTAFPRCNSAGAFSPPPPSARPSSSKVI
jgi:O-antigen/teichoic acid export membrane protein